MRIKNINVYNVNSYSVKFLKSISKFNLCVKESKFKTENKTDEFFYEKNVDDKKINTISITEKNQSKLKEVMIKDEEFSQPIIENEAYRELYRNFSYYANEESSKDIDLILHNEELNGKKYKYGLPIINELPFSDLIKIDIDAQALPKSATENLYELLDLNKESSFESMLLKFQNEFNHEADMYGNLVKAGDTKHKIFEYGVPIPLEVIKDNKIMNRLRGCVMYNKDLPGNIQDIHPNKFIANLRPIEEFRHTPIVPIPEKEIREFKKKIEEKSRMGVYLEIKKQTIYYYGIAVIFAFIMYLNIKYFYNESEKMQADIERIRFRRYRYRQEEDIN